MSSTNLPDLHAFFLEACCRDVGRWFGDLVFEKLKSGMVLVRYEENPGKHFLWVPADDHGFPKQSRFDFAILEPPTVAAFATEAITAPNIATRSLYLQEPTMVCPDRENIMGRPYVFMWRGLLEQGPREKYAKELSVQELIILAQQKIVEREPRVLGTASRNRLIGPLGVR